MQEGVGLRSDVEEGAVGLDGLDGALEGGANHQIGEGSAGLGTALLVLCNGGTGGALGVVSLFVRGNSVHRLHLLGDLGRDLGGVGLGGGIRHAQGSRSSAVGAAAARLKNWMTERMAYMMSEVIIGFQISYNIYIYI